MSTKIYTAYVLRDRRQLWPVCRKIRERCETHVRKELTRIYRALIADAADRLGKPDDPFKKHRSTDGSFGVMDAGRYVQDAYGAQLTRMDRDFFDLTVSVAVREASDGRILMIPYSGSGYLSGSLDFMRRMPELRDYHYQNSTDRPRRISAREWARRRRTWEPLLNEWRRMLVLELVSYNGWYDVSPAFEMARAEARKRGRKP